MSEERGYPSLARDRLAKPVALSRAGSNPAPRAETVRVDKKLFFILARDVREYEMDIVPTEDSLNELREKGVDIFTFAERGWCFEAFDPPSNWVKAPDNVALLCIDSYEEWLKGIVKKTRHNPVKRAEKKGIKTAVVESSEELAKGIWRIYNETPIRQERAFPHYGISLEAVKQSVMSQSNGVYIGAYFQSELAGFIQLSLGDNVAVITQILSLAKHFDKNVNKALVAKAVETCASRNEHWLMYARMGNHPSLDRFKRENGFTKFPITRYYIPLTRRGKIATTLGLHRDIKDALPSPIKSLSIPVYNWVSRTKVKIKMTLQSSSHD
jgi:hypothetical protein